MEVFGTLKISSAQEVIGMFVEQINRRNSEDALEFSYGILRK